MFTQTEAAFHVGSMNYSRIITNDKEMSQTSKHYFVIFYQTEQLSPLGQGHLSILFECHQYKSKTLKTSSTDELLNIKTNHTKFIYHKRWYIKTTETVIKRYAAKVSLDLFYFY